MEFSVSVDTRDAQTVLALTGELDLAARDLLRQHVTALLAQGERRVLVDLAEVRFCDSSGLSALIRAKRETVDAGGWLVVVGATGMVAELFETTQLDRYFAEAPAERSTEETVPGLTVD